MSSTLSCGQWDIDWVFFVIVIVVFINCLGSRKSARKLHQVAKEPDQGNNETAAMEPDDDLALETAPMKPEQGNNDLALETALEDDTPQQGLFGVAADVLIGMCHFLEIGDVISLEKTCRFAATITKNPHAIQSMYILRDKQFVSVRGQWDGEESNYDMTNFLTGLRQPRFANVQRVTVWDSILPYVNWPQLTHLDIYNIGDRYEISSFQNLLHQPKLENIKCDLLSLPTLHEILPYYSNNNIKTLEITGLRKMASDIGCVCYPKLKRLIIVIELYLRKDKSPWKSVNLITNVVKSKVLESLEIRYENLWRDSGGMQFNDEIIGFLNIVGRVSMQITALSQKFFGQLITRLSRIESQRCRYLKISGRINLVITGDDYPDDDYPDDDYTDYPDDDYPDDDYTNSPKDIATALRNPCWPAPKLEEFKLNVEFQIFFSVTNQRHLDDIEQALKKKYMDYSHVSLSWTARWEDTVDACCTLLWVTK